MAQTIPLVDALKRSLKSHGMTYADVASRLNLTEASVKRLFADRSFSLNRLDCILAMMEMEFTDLVQQMNEQASVLEELTAQQETTVVSDSCLLLILICLVNRWSADEILSYYEIPQNDLIRHLAHLDRMKIIDLLPANRVKLRICANFRWRENGPIQQFFQHTVEQEFFSARFHKSTEKLIVVNAMLTDNSNIAIQRRMQRLSREFAEISEADLDAPISERYGNTLVIAIRRWEYSLFKKYKRDPKRPAMSTWK